MKRDNSNNGILDRHLRCATHLEREGASFADPYLQDAHQDRGLLLARVAQLEKEIRQEQERRVAMGLPAVTPVRQSVVEQLASRVSLGGSRWARLCRAMFPTKGAPNAEEDR